MSAYMVTSKTINRVLNFIANDRDCTQYRTDLAHTFGHNLNIDEERAKLGAEMFELNREAVSQRYPNARQMVAGEYAFANDNCDMLQALASLECWLYQCTEGDVPQQPLYTAFKDIEHWLAKRIIHNLPGWRACQWG
jgi:hypothetical protein